MAFTTLAKVDEIPLNSGKEITVNGKALAVFNAGGTFFVIDNQCPHRGAALAEGVVEGMEVECPWHRARFDLQTGAHLCPPALRGVKSYPLQVVGQEIQADV